MNKSKIEWCDYTWNPVTGCLHGCDYCYARRIANRFSMKFAPLIGDFEGKLYDGSYSGRTIPNDGIMYDLYKPVTENECIQPYPAGFMPTFHRYRLAEPQKVKKPSKIFVVSMGDLFGKWVPDEWIQEVLKVVRECPQHTFMFLTKNPNRYYSFEFPVNAWVGASAVNKPDEKVMPIDGGFKVTTAHLVADTMSFFERAFLSIEPLLNDVSKDIDIECIDWVIVGAQTGPGSKPPKKEWVQNLIDMAKEYEVPIFLKNNLNWPEKIQEFPEGLL